MVKTGLFIRLERWDLLLINGDANPPVLVSYREIKDFSGQIPYSQRATGQLDMELIDVICTDLFIYLYASRSRDVAKR